PRVVSPSNPGRATRDLAFFLPQWLKPTVRWRDQPTKRQSACPDPDGLRQEGAPNRRARPCVPYLLKEARRSLTACRACFTAFLIAVRSALMAVRVDLITGRSCLRAPLTPFAAARSAFSWVRSALSAARAASTSFRSCTRSGLIAARACARVEPFAAAASAASF